MSINLLKRLESSVHSFRLTVDRMRKKIDETIKKINNYELGSEEIELTDIAAGEDFDYDDQNTDFFSVGKKVKIDLADMDYVSWRRELERDAENLELLSLMIADITPKHDTKLQTLFDLIRKKSSIRSIPVIRRSLFSRRFLIPQTIFLRTSADLRKRISGWKRQRSPARLTERPPYQSSVRTLTRF